MRKYGGVLYGWGKEPVRKQIELFRLRVLQRDVVTVSKHRREGENTLISERTFGTTSEGIFSSQGSTVSSE
jgi:hypothetical protein